MSVTSIEWTDRVWNPTRGCSRVSPGCVNCYAERMAARVSAFGAKPDSPFAGFVTKVNGHAAWTGKVELIESKLDEPLSWRKPVMVFVNSMSDLWHWDLDAIRIISRVYAVMAACPQHTFQVLTKRPDHRQKFLNSDIFKRAVDERLRCYPRRHPQRSEWPLPNVWEGVSVEDRKNKDRIDLLRETPAALRFLSIEPLLEDIGELDLRGISWVIIGGESGPGARPFNIAWARSVVEQCKAADVAVFVKQLGANARTNAIRGYDDAMERIKLLDKKGGDMAEWSEDLRVREFPKGAA